MSRIVMLDNRDSFVYNLVDALGTTDERPLVFRNNVAVDTILAAEPDLIVLSPGPCHPRQAGCMMDLIDATLGRIPLLGICLGFQALLEHFGANVRPVGPVHGQTDQMRVLVEHPMFHVKPGETIGVARYHSLGTTDHVPGLTPLGVIGDLIMAAETEDHMAVGLQFHPESILTPTGPSILQSALDYLLEGKNNG